MKSIRTFYTISGTILILCFLLSCHVARKGAIDCPQFSQNRLVRNNTRNSTNKIFANRSSQKKYSYKPFIRTEQYHKSSIPEKVSGPISLEPYPYFGIGGLSKKDYLNKLVVSTENTIIFQSSPCDTIFLLSGAWMNAKIEKIDPDKIQYRICDNLSGIINTIGLSDVAYIKYSNGFRKQIAKCDTIFLKTGEFRYVKIVKETQSKLMFRNYSNLNGPVITVSKSDLSAIKYYVEEPAIVSKNSDTILANINNNDTITIKTNNNGIKKTEPLAIDGLLTLIVSLAFMRPLIMFHPILWLILLLMGPILGASSLSRIKKYPEKYKGKGLAKFSIIIGLSFIAILLLSIILLI